MADIKKITLTKDGATKLVDETNKAVIAELTAAGWSELGAAPIIESKEPKSKEPKKGK